MLATESPFPQYFDLAGAPLVYGKAGFENPHFVARGRV